MTSSHAVGRSLWVMGVLLGASIAFYFLVRLFVLYFSYEITMSTNEVVMSDIEFPSLTVCNLNPLANTNIQLQQLVHGFDEFRNVTNRLDNSEDDIRYLYGEVLTPANIFANLGLDGWMRARDFVVSCRWDGDLFLDESSCMSSVHMHLYQTNYGYCFTLDPPANSSITRGFAGIFYLDDSLGVSVPSFELNMARSFASGALLVAHQRGSLPNFEDGIVLSAGRSSEIHIYLQQRIRLSEPYSDCDPEPGLPVEENHLYTFEACWALCNQNEIIQRCGCVDGITLSTESQLVQNYTYCAIVDRNIPDMERVEVFTNRSMCIRSVFGNALLCESTCPVQCIEKGYKLTSAEISWPHPMTQLAFYDRYIRGKRYQNRFQLYGNLSEKLAHGTREFTDTYNLLKQRTEIEENFLEVRNR